MNDTAATADVEKPGQPPVAGELSEFLVQLSVALHRHSMYPIGHPSLGPVIEAVLGRANRLESVPTLVEN